MINKTAIAVTIIVCFAAVGALDLYLRNMRYEITELQSVTAYVLDRKTGAVWFVDSGGRHALSTKSQ